MNEFHFPTDLASCPTCRCLVAVARYQGGVTREWDPRFVDRRMAVSAIGIRRWGRWLKRGQRWGLSYDMDHECPPPADAPAEEVRRDQRIF